MLQYSVFVLSFLLCLSYLVQAGTFHKSVNNNVYYVEPSYNYKWFEAHIECYNRNMTLFTIENEDAFYDLYNILISGRFNRSPPHLWLGGIGAQRKFTWISNGKPVVWKYGSPDNARNAENCIQLYENTKDINDRNCNDQLGFVCEENKYRSTCNNGLQQQKMADKYIVLNIHQNSKAP
ncbi:hypothetical protein DOY81_000679 [Sarcophaga bullata]|nr:hypothetical protein DOY81_000679 [Sarcophaga bullata]